MSKPEAAPPVRKGGLGRGLAALIPQGPADDATPAPPKRPMPPRGGAPAAPGGAAATPAIPLRSSGERATPRSASCRAAST